MRALSSLLTAVQAQCGTIAQFALENDVRHVATCMSNIVTTQVTLFITEKMYYNPRLPLKIQLGQTRVLANDIHHMIDACTDAARSFVSGNGIMGKVYHLRFVIDLKRITMALHKELFTSSNYCQTSVKFWFALSDRSEHFKKAASRMKSRQLIPEKKAAWQCLHHVTQIRMASLSLNANFKKNVPEMWKSIFKAQAVCAPFERIPKITNSISSCIAAMTLLKTHSPGSIALHEQLNSKCNKVADALESILDAGFLQKIKNLIKK
eukprot:TRINITY_DN5770_c0_g1_i6.p1 TRINITY_DN5770_c0_g1~~TRINITY_DN5770_c0_g1_i6.p1  ORF type:complete len:265 (-),score=29.15 TRINITY_DN5770_c0_g1_i6:18-812(-)